jgi:CRP-like cAMP-binding protein
MATNTKADQLGRVQIFSACTDRELAQIARAADERSVDTGTTVVEQGQAGHQLYLIVSGDAKVVRDGTDEATLGPGQYFGELALLDDLPRSASVVSTSPMTLLVLGQREFFAVLDEWPTVARKLLSTVATRLRDAEQGTASH